MNTFRNWRIGARLALAFAGVVTLIAALAVLGFIELGTARSHTQQLVGPQMERLLLVSEWRENIIVNSQRTLALVYSGDAALAARFAEDMKAVTARTSEIQKRVAEMEGTPGAHEAMARLAQARQVYFAHRDPLLKSPPADAAEREKAIAAFKAATQAYVDEATRLRQHEQGVGAAMGKEVIQGLDGTQRNLLAAAVAAALLSGALGWWLARGIVRPLAQAEAAAQRIAGGDLSAAVPQGGQDEVGRLLASLGAMQDALRALVGDIRQSVDGIGTASAEVASGNQDLSARTEQSAASLQQTASAVEQIAATMRHSRESAHQADDLARQASNVAAAGGQAVSRVVRAMENINQSSRRIADITGTIDAIAFQTNILALNAAVEAARAGEQGRGFAVVASEVRNLAQRSAEAAREIKGLIQDSVQRTSEGAQEAGQAGGTIEGVVASVQRVTGIVGEIARAATEQTRGIEQVNQAVSQLDRATQQNAALVEESAAAATSLKDQAGMLSCSVQRFRLP